MRFGTWFPNINLPFPTFHRVKHATWSLLIDPLIRLKIFLFTVNLSCYISLLITDESALQVAPVIHEWTYDAMIHDLLDMDGNKYIHEVWGSSFLHLSCRQVFHNLPLLIELAITLGCQQNRGFTWEKGGPSRRTWCSLAWASPFTYSRCTSYSLFICNHFICLESNLNALLPT